MVVLSSVHPPWSVPVLLCTGEDIQQLTTTHTYTTTNKHANTPSIPPPPGLLRRELEGVIEHDIADAYRRHKAAFTAPDVLQLVSWAAASQALVASNVGR